MSDFILDIVRRKVEPSKVRHVSSNKGGEWHSPCPVCGGDDRFHVWPAQEGGEVAQRAGISGTWWCRQCLKTGDVIELLEFSEGLNFTEACKALRIELQSGPRFRPLRQPQAGSGLSGWTPSEWKIPPEKWRAQATKLALAGHGQLLENAAVLAYLARRGLPLEAVQRYRLGYLEGEDRAGTCLYRARSAFDLPDRKNRDGTKTRTVMWIPRGLTIPLWCGEEVHRIRIRRRKEDLQDGKDSKYMLLEGSGQAPMVLPPAGVSDDLATWVVVEAELDACAVHHACGGKVGVLASLTNVGKPDAAAHRLLSRAKLILVALDFDAPGASGKRPGYQGWLWWRERYIVARRWPVPRGKDPGEAFAAGVNLADWVQAGIPGGLSGNLGKSELGLDVFEEGSKVTPAAWLPGPVATRLGLGAPRSPVEALEMIRRLGSRPVPFLDGFAVEGGDLLSAEERVVLRMWTAEHRDLIVQGMEGGNIRESSHA